jgi:hypothetical protein
MGVVSIGPTVSVGPLDLCPFVRKTRDTRVEAHHVPAGQKTILAFQKGEQPNSTLLSSSPQVVGFTIIPDYKIGGHLGDWTFLKTYFSLGD